MTSKSAANWWEWAKYLAVEEGGFVMACSHRPRFTADGYVSLPLLQMEAFEVGHVTHAPVRTVFRLDRVSP